MMADDLRPSAHAPAPALAPLPQATRYLGELLQALAGPLPLDRDAPRPPPLGEAAVVEQVLDLLCGRRFTHLSRAQAQPYRTRMRPLLLADVVAGRALRFDYDLGPGYHASVRADCTGLRFAPGLGELLALRQIRLLDQAVRAVHAPGVRFQLVLDDLCAWVCNDVAPESTAAYVRRLNALVDATGMRGLVEVLAESALVSAPTYRRSYEQQPLVLLDARPVGPAERDNVSRFVGRVCSLEQAREHLARYARAQVVSEQVLAAHLTGVRLTQRATPQCLGFRSFPGGAARLQTGEVDLLLAPGAAPRPVLITTHNSAHVQRLAVGTEHLPAAWPQALGEVCVAVPWAEPPEL